MISVPLPTPKAEYNADDFKLLLEYVEALEEVAYQRNANVEIIGQEDSGTRKPDLILHSPDGTRYAIRVDNAGLITATAV